MNDILPSPEPAPMLARRNVSLMTPPQARHRRPIVLVLGMHRSGTSLCSQILSALGVDMADDIAPHASNPTGQWERREIVDLHDRILDHFNRGFYTPYHDFSLPVAWWADPRVSDIRREMVGFLTARMGQAPFGFKDPRTARLMPMWHQMFSELELEPKIISCLRNPAQVARSLHARDGIDTEIGELRWFAYVVDSFRYTKNCDICVVEYENWFEDPAANLKKLRDFIGPSWLERELDTEALVSSIIDDELRHDDREHRHARHPLIRSVYGLARRADRDPAARDQLLAIAAQYVSFDQMQRALQRSFERNTERALLVAPLEQEAAALQARVDERDAALAIANHRAEESATHAAAIAARAQAALAEIDRHRIAVGELTRQRDAAQFAAAEAVHAEINRLRESLAAADLEARQRGAELDNAGGELAALRETLAAAEVEARQRGAELDNAGRELAALRETLAAAEAEARERGAELDNAGRELATLRETLPATERLAAEFRAATERELAAAASIAEITTHLKERTDQLEADAARESAALAEIDRLRLMIEELTRQRDTAQLAAVEAVHGEVARLREALAAAEREAYERAAEIDGTRRELAELHQAVAGSETLAAEIRAATERELATAESIADLAARLAERTAWAEAAAADESAARAEIDKQRIFISELIRQRDTAQIDAAEALHDELSGLRDALAAAEREACDRAAEFASTSHEIAELRQALAGAEILAGDIRAAAEREVDAAANFAEVTLRLAERTVEATANKAGESAALAAVETAHLEIARLREALAAADAQARQQAAEFENIAAAGIADLTTRLAERSRAAAESEAALQTRVTALAAELANANARRPSSFNLLSRVTQSSIRRRVGAAVRAGDSARRSGKWVAAARHYHRALDRSPDLTAIWVQLGHALKEQGDHRGAEDAYRRSLALEASVADTHLQLGHLLKLMSRWGEAADCYARALQLDPALPDAGGELDRLTPLLLDQGDKARDGRDWAAAARHYRRALDRQPDLMPIWVQFGHALKEQGDYLAAEAAYRRALALDRSVADTHLQLGHLLKLQARRALAIDAYATAIRLDPDLAAARESLHALVGYSPSETERAIRGDGGFSRSAPGSPGIYSATVIGDVAEPRDIAAPAGFAADPPIPLSPADRYGALFVEARHKNGPGHDIIWLGVIDWHFRIQRPQHLAANLADAGARIFYVSIVFEPADEKGRFRIIESPHAGVFEIRMRVANDACESIYQGLGERTIGELQLALDELVAVLGIQAPIVLVEHPAWHQVACGVPGATVVYDCLDLATGFSNVAESTASAEDAMLASADLVITASRPLAEHVSHYRSSVIIRNAAEVEFFAQGYSDGVAGERPVIGYFGAIADWFNIEWIEHCAAARPHWDFRLIGRTDGCDISRAAKLPNVRFFGEKPYQELPLFLREVDVAVIPFRLVELIRCTNPVKLYEYMAAGKAVVAAPMPEVIEATDLVYIADDAASFTKCIEQALAEDSPELRQRRQNWAREHNWASRADQLSQAVDAVFPLVSIVVLTYNNWEFTSACLFSLRSWSDYPNLEIIVVDNASSDQTRERLRALERQDRRIRVILNDANLGFAGGNNVGLRNARGEYAILLNNDTFVTRGWVRDLIRPMQLDTRIGLVGPLTNNIGNEQKVDIAYRDMQEMQDSARRFVRGRLRRTLDAANLAFFCVAIRRSVLEEVGFLDEVYGVGFFEDDDYCRRVGRANYKMVIADDVFVHHHLSASFAALGTKAGELMVRNRAIFEERWGPWQPHRYRNEPGFG